MNDNTEDLEEAIERASLLPSRYYIVIRDSEEEEGTLKMIAYDTTKEEEDDEYIPAGVVLLSGIMELIENDFERVMNAGMARISFQATQQDMLEEVCKEEATVEHLPNSNIVKINFGKVQ
jgi:hypothetical protein